MPANATVMPTAAMGLVRPEEGRDRRRSVSEVFGPEAYAVVRPHLREAAQGERVSYEYCRRNAQGRTVHARSVVVPDVSVEGGFQGYFVLSVDITEQKASEAALIQAQKMEAVANLRAGSPMTSTTCSPSSSATSPPSRTSRAPPRTNTSIRRCTRPPGRGADPPPADFLETPDARAARGRCRRDRAKHAAVAFALDHRVDHGHHGDTRNSDLRDGRPHQLENALVNLAINARDAMPGGGKLNIRISERTIDPSIAPLVEVPAGRYVQFDVADTGSGIDPASAARVRAVFHHQALRRRKRPGPSMVYGFLRQSGGNIRILSTPARAPVCASCYHAAKPRSSHARQPGRRANRRPEAAGWYCWPKTNPRCAG